MSIEELEKNGFCYCLKAWGNRMHWYCVKSLKYLYNEEYFRIDLRHALDVFRRMESEGLYVNKAATKEEMHWEGEGCPVVDAKLYEYIGLVTIGESPNSTDHYFEEPYSEYDKNGKEKRECHFPDFLYALVYLYGEVFHRELNLQRLEGKVDRHKELSGHLDLLNKALSPMSQLSPKMDEAIADSVEKQSDNIISFAVEPSDIVFEIFNNNRELLRETLEFCKDASPKDVGNYMIQCRIDRKVKSPYRPFYKDFVEWINANNGTDYKIDTVRKRLNKMVTV